MNVPNDNDKNVQYETTKRFLVGNTKVNILARFQEQNSFVTSYNFVKLRIRS